MTSLRRLSRHRRLSAFGLLALLTLLLAAGKTTSGAARRVASDAKCVSPYARSSPWNTPIGPHPTYDPASAALIGTVTSALSSDPTQYTYPVSVAEQTTPKVTVRVLGTFSDVANGGHVLVKRTDGASVQVPLASDARPSSGTDGQLIVAEPSTGDEWGFWRIARDASGNWSATNGYHYNTHWSGVPPPGFGSRGAGVTYLAGLIRPCEVEQAHIDHALAFAYNWPSPAFIYPATKSDGRGQQGVDMPEGTRLQLDPTLSPGQIRAWGCVNACLTIAEALQTYGMYVIDNSGHAKLMAEDDQTARWNGLVSAKTPGKIPLTAFEVVTDTPPVVRALPSAGQPGRRLGLRYTVYDGGGQTRERAVVTKFRGKVVATLESRFHETPVPGRTLAIAWKAPRRLQGQLRFCITSTDPGGHKSAASCSVVTLLARQ